MKIFIENGHGQFTAGKRSPDGQPREAFFNREIARRIVLDLLVQQTKGTGFREQSVPVEAYEMRGSPDGEYVPTCLT